VDIHFHDGCAEGADLGDVWDRLVGDQAEA
jgi:hypothetical protein